MNKYLWTLFLALFLSVSSGAADDCNGICLPDNVPGPEVDLSPFQQLINGTLINNSGVIGKDDRQVILDPSSDSRTQYILSGKLVIGIGNNRFKTCTATLVGIDRILTAAHCLYDDKNDSFYPGPISFQLQTSKDIYPYSHINAKKIYLSKKFVELKRKEKNPESLTHKQIQYDLAMLTLVDDIGERLGYHGLKYDDAQNDEISLRIAGYPADYELMTYQKCNGKRSKYHSMKLDLDCDVTPGLSGSSLLDNDSFVRGVASSRSQEKKSPNGASFFSRETFELAAGWKHDIYSEHDTIAMDIDSDNNYQLIIENGVQEPIYLSYVVERNGFETVELEKEISAGQSFKIENLTSNRALIRAFSKKSRVLWNGRYEAVIEHEGRQIKQNFTELDMGFHRGFGSYTFSFYNTSEIKKAGDLAKK